jgi:hypothetical protein
MFHATIDTGGPEPLRVSGQVVPYDLQVLREHVLARRGRTTRVHVRVAAADQQALLRALGDVARRGIELVVHP